MTPYARCSTRLSRRRDEENVFWRTRKGGDPRLTGQAAHERVNERLGYVNTGGPSVSQIFEALFSTIRSYLPRDLRRSGVRP